MRDDVIALSLSVDYWDRLSRMVGTRGIEPLTPTMSR